MDQVARKWLRMDVIQEPQETGSAITIRQIKATQYSSLFYDTQAAVSSSQKPILCT